MLKIYKKIEKEFKNYTQEINWSFSEINKWVKQDNELSLGQADLVKELTSDIEKLISDKK